MRSNAHCYRQRLCGMLLDRHADIVSVASARPGSRVAPQRTVSPFWSWRRWPRERVEQGSGGHIDRWCIVHCGDGREWHVRETARRGRLYSFAGHLLVAPGGRARDCRLQAAPGWKWLMAGTITSIDVQARNPRRVNVHLDGQFAFALSLEVATLARLKRSMTLSDDDIAALQADDVQQKTYDAVLNFVSFRPRSEYEVRRYLNRRKTPPDLTDRLVARLTANGLLDDDAFARFWVENRSTFNPRSDRALRAELRSKGVDDGTITAVLPQDDSAAAYDAATRRARRMVAVAGADADIFRRKLLGYLQRRGFSYDVARETVDRVWREVVDAREGAA